MDSTYVGKSRREREEEFRRNQVLDIAEMLFSANGFDGTTVSEIAERSELAKGSLYQLFKSKQEIIDAIVERKVVEMMETLDAIFDRETSPLEKLFQIMESKLRGIWHHRDFARLFINEFHGFNWYMETPILECCREKVMVMLERMEILITEGQKCGEIRDDIPYKLILASMGGISNAVIHLWLREELDLDIDKTVQMAKDLFAQGISPLRGVNK
jgi:AcrR family transcriptional regulator